VKIAHFLMNVRLRDGGVVRAVLDLCALLAAGGDDVTLMCCGEAEIPGSWRTAGPGVPRVENLGEPGRGGLLGGAALGRAAAVLEGSDAVHLHGMWELSNYQIARACRRAGKPYIYSPHGMLDDWAMGVRSGKKRLVLALAGRRVLERARYVHFAAAGEMEDSRKRIGRAEPRVVPLVFDASAFARLPGPKPAQRTWPEIADGRPVIFFLSRLVPNKGADLAIEAAADVIRGGIDARVVVAGDGGPAEVAGLKGKAASAGVADWVTFTGHVGGELKLSLFQAATVFVLPTIHENFGFATIEALACGCPAVTTTGNMLRGELASGGGAMIVTREVRAIADGLRAILQDPARRAAMSAAGRRWVGEFLDPDAILARYRALYS
jgi:glycosyltransferase involved in cell wall biosynthesis